jgi:hypothetical protein
MAAYGRQTVRSNGCQIGPYSRSVVERMFDSVLSMSERPDAAAVLRAIRDTVPNRKMGTRAGGSDWTRLTLVNGVDVTDTVDGALAEGLVVDTLAGRLELTERGRALLDRLGPDGRFDLPGRL